MSMDTTWTLPLYPPTVCVFFLHLLTKNYLILDAYFAYYQYTTEKYYLIKYKLLTTWKLDWNRRLE